MENFETVWARTPLVKHLQVLDHIISDRCVFYYWTVTALGN